MRRLAVHCFKIVIDGEGVENSQPLLVISRDNGSIKHGHPSYAWEIAVILGPLIEEPVDD